MCRHLAYVGSAVAVGSLLLEPPHGLVRQAWAPRRQRHGTVNADGFGLGWYAAGDPHPARYRRDHPIWTDADFVDLCRVVRTTGLLAAVRDGTPGLPYDAATVAPYAGGPYLFSHNGAVPGWPLPALLDGLPAAELLAAPATDSAVLWAHVRRHLEAGESLPSALAAVVAAAAGAAVGASAGADARLNLLVTDGARIAATVWGDTLCWRRLTTGVVVASEPYDDDPAWREVPDRSQLLATATNVTISPLPEEPR